MLLSPVSSINEMNKELQHLTLASGLEFDCGCGGKLTSNIAVIAEAPGEREVQQKTPLIGGSGKYLWDVLRKDRITRNDVYVTNVVKRKLVSAADAIDVGERAQKITLTKQERVQWKHILWEELSRLPNLKYVVALGNYAIEALIGYEGITQLRGSVYRITINGRDIQALATFNPAHVMREARMEIVFRMDLNKLQRLMKGTFSVPRIDYLINPTFTEAMDTLQWLAERTEPIAYDIETMADETACVGFAASNTEGICINFRSQGRNHFTLSEERDVRLAIQGLLGSPNHKFVTQNGHYDATWLWFKDRIRVDHHWFDTMLAHHFLYPPLPHDLGFITAQYTDHPYYKDEGKLWKEDGDINAFWEYNVKDCCITRMCAERMEQELLDAGLHDVFHNHVMRLQPELVQMTINGVLVDERLKDQFSDDLEQALLLQERYAKRRLVWQLETQISRSIPEVLLNLVNSSLRDLGWSEEEVAQIRRIGIVLEGIRELHQQLENLSQPLISTYSKPSSSAHTLTPAQMTMDASGARIDRPELPLPLADSALVRPVGAVD